MYSSINSVDLICPSAVSGVRYQVLAYVRYRAARTSLVYFEAQSSVSPVCVAGLSVSPDNILHF